MTTPTNIATPVIRKAVGISDFTCSNLLGIENVGRPWGMSPT